MSNVRSRERDYVPQGDDNAGYTANGAQKPCVKRGSARSAAGRGGAARSRTSEEVPHKHRNGVVVAYGLIGRNLVARSPPRALRVTSPRRRRERPSFILLPPVDVSRTTLATGVLEGWRGKDAYITCGSCRTGTARAERGNDTARISRGMHVEMQRP